MENAVCYDPAQFAMSGVRDAHVRAGDYVVVVGLGAIGQIAIQLAKKLERVLLLGSIHLVTVVKLLKNMEQMLLLIRLRQMLA